MVNNMNENQPKLNPKFSFLVGLIIGVAVITVGAFVGILVLATGNGDKTDNRIENLKLFKNQSEHMRQEQHRRRGKTHI